VDVVGQGSSGVSSPTTAGGLTPRSTDQSGSSEFDDEPVSCCAAPAGYCAAWDTLFKLPGVHVLGMAWRESAVGPKPEPQRLAALRAGGARVRLEGYNRELES
jgi:hypothetical protein